MTDIAAVKKDKNFDLAEYCKQVFQMFDSEICTVQIRCDNSLMKTIIDRFGESVQTETADPKHFIATVQVATSATFYGWIFGFGGKIQIVSPDEIKAEYIALAKKIYETQ